MVRAVAVFAAALPLFSGSAWAQSQSQPEDDPRSTARMHIGPFYLTPVIAVKNVGVDTNVFNTADDPKSDFTATIGPDIDVYIPISLASLSVKSLTDFVYFHSFASERSINEDLVVRGEVPIRRLTLFSENSYLNTRERPNFEIDVRSRRVENQFEVGVSVDLARKLSVQVSGRQASIEFDADEFFQGNSLAERLNRDSRTAAVALNYQLTPITTVVLTGEVTETRFRLSPLRDSDSFSIVPGVEFNPRSIISGSAHVGFRKFVGLNASLPGFEGTVAAVDLRYRLLGSTVIGVTVDRNIDYSFEIDDPYYVATGYGGSVRRQLGSRFDAIVAAQQYTYRYRGLEGEAEQDLASERIDTRRNYSFSIGYRRNRGARFDVSVSYWQRRSDERDFQNYQGFRLGSNVTYGF
jgi:hypothetical protein